MPAYVHDTAYFSRRTLILVGLIGFHVLLIYMLASGLARRVVEVIAAPIETKIIEEQQPRELPPPPPPPEFERPQVEIPPPEVHIEMPAEPTTAITDVTTKPVPKTQQQVAPAPSSKIHANGKFPNTDDFYPPSSIRLEEQGSITVKYCVGPNGRLVEQPVVVQSSHSARLDDAAVRLVRAGRFTPGSLDGVPTTDCNSIRIKFELKQH